jgi:hypothetical protein
VDRELRQIAWLDGYTLRVNSLFDGEVVFASDVDLGLEKSRVTGAPVAGLVFPDSDCGVLLVDSAGRLQWIPTTLAGGLERSHGLAVGSGLRLFGGSVEGTLRGTIDDRRVQWSPEGWTRRTALDGALEVGGYEIDLAEAGPRLRSRAGGEVLEFEWPEIGGRPDLHRESVAISPDGRFAAISRWNQFPLSPIRSQPPNDGVEPGRVLVVELPSGRTSWTRELGPHVTAITLADDALWLAEGPPERVTISAFDLDDEHRLRRWRVDDPGGAIVALARVPGERSLIGIRAEHSELQRWSLEGRAEGRWRLDTRGWTVTVPKLAMLMEYGSRDLSGQELRVSSDGKFVRLAAPFLLDDELRRLSDGKLVASASQIEFADEPGIVLLNEYSRVTAMDLDDRSTLWSLRIYADDEWVWWDPSSLRGRSAGASEASSVELLGER